MALTTRQQQHFLRSSLSGLECSALTTLQVLHVSTYQVQSLCGLSSRRYGTRLSQATRHVRNRFFYFSSVSVWNEFGLVRLKTRFGLDIITIYYSCNS